MIKEVFQNATPYIGSRSTNREQVFPLGNLYKKTDTVDWEQFLEGARDQDPLLVEVAGEIIGIGSLSIPTKPTGVAAFFSRQSASDAGMIKPLVKFDPPLPVDLADKRVDLYIQVSKGWLPVSTAKFKLVLELAYQLAVPGQLVLNVANVAVSGRDGNPIRSDAGVQLVVTLKNTGRAAWVKGTTLSAECSWRQDTLILSPTQIIPLVLGVDLPPMMEWSVELSSLSAPRQRKTGICQLVVVVEAPDYSVKTDPFQTDVTVETAQLVSPLVVYTNQSAALHSSPNVLSPKSLTLPANTPLQVVDADPVAALKRVGDPDQWLEVQAQVDGEQVRGFIEADLVRSEPIVVERRASQT